MYGLLHDFPFYSYQLWDGAKRVKMNTHTFCEEKDGWRGRSDKQKQTEKGKKSVQKVKAIAKEKTEYLPKQVCIRKYVSRAKAEFKLFLRKAFNAFIFLLPHNGKIGGKVLMQTSVHIELQSGEQQQQQQ